MYRIFTGFALVILLLPGCDLFTKNHRHDQEAYRIDSLKIALDSVETGLLTLEKRYHSGTIRYKPYIRQKMVYEKAYQEISIQLGGLHKAYKLPGWARSLGLMEPTGMILDSTLSQETSVDREGEGFNSVTLVYISSADTAKMWADSIAKTADLIEVNDYLVRSRKASTIKAKEASGVKYLNYDLKPGDKEYLVSVEADEEGLLTITATNMQQLNEKLSGYRSLKVRKEKQQVGKKQ